MASRWESTSDPELEWQLSAPLLILAVSAGLVAFAIDRYFYVDPTVWFLWGVRTFWIPFVPVLALSSIRWRRYLRDTRDVRPEISGGRDPNRIAYWGCVVFFIPVVLVFCMGQLASVLNALEPSPPITITGTVVETTFARWAHDNVLIQGPSAQIRLEVSPSFASAAVPGQRVSIDVRYGLLGFAYYTSARDAKLVAGD